MPDPTPDKQNPFQTYIAIASGLISGMISPTAHAPLNRVQLLLQTQHSSPYFISTNRVSEEGKYPKYLQIF